MKFSIFFSLIFIHALSCVGQSLKKLYPTEGRRGAYVSFTLTGKNTHFTAATYLNIVLKSRENGSEIVPLYVTANADYYCTGLFEIPYFSTSGGYDLKVTTSNEGVLILDRVFTVSNELPIPVIDSISPRQASMGDYIEMTIHTKHTKFMDSIPDEVYLDGACSYIKANTLEPLNDSTLTASFTIPEYLISHWCNVVMKDGKDSAILVGDFRLIGVYPYIVSITPSTVSTGSNAYIYIHTKGTQLTQEPHLSAYLWGSAQSLSVINDTTLIAQFEIPQFAYNGSQDITLSIGGCTMTFPLVVSGISPELHEVSPDTVVQRDLVDILIKGTNLYFVTSSSLSTCFYNNEGRYYADTTIVLSDNQIKAIFRIPKHILPGKYSIEVKNDLVSASLPDALTILEDGLFDPYLVSLSPYVVSKGQVLDLTIKSIGTTFTKSSSLTVSFSKYGIDYYKPTRVQVINDTQLVCRFVLPVYAASGVYSLKVLDDDECYIKFDCFIIGAVEPPEPVLVSVTPSDLKVGQSVDIEISSRYTHFQASNVTLTLTLYPSFSGLLSLEPLSYKTKDFSTISAHFRIPDDFPTGLYDLSVVSNLDGFLSLPYSVTIDPADPLGLLESTGQARVLYPNPVQKILNVESQSEVLSCVIQATTGKQLTIDINELKQDPTHLVISIEKLGLKEGIYFIRLETDNGFDYWKFIVE